MLLRPTRVRAKPVRFHISAHVPAKNAPDFILSNKDTPKTRPVLHPNLRRGYLSGVCNTPLHGYVQNSTGFRRKSLSQDISGRMQYAPTRIHEKSARFHISAHGYVKNAPDFILPNRDTPKTRPVLDPNLRRKTFGGVCFYAPTRVHRKNGQVSYFRTQHTPKTHPISYFPIGIHPKPARF